MAGATPWTELAITDATGWVEGFPIPIGNAVILFSIVMPIEGGFGFIDPTTSYTELSISATASTELTLAAATAYTELTL
jgi:hypothetical protein